MANANLFPIDDDFKKRVIKRRESDFSDEIAWVDGAIAILELQSDDDGSIDCWLPLGDASRPAALKLLREYRQRLAMVSPRSANYANAGGRARNADLPKEVKGQRGRLYGKGP